MLFHADPKKFALVTLLVTMQSACPVIAQGLGQSAWTSPGQSIGTEAGLGQSPWSTPGQSQGLGQSQWTTPGQAGATNVGFGQSSWTSAEGSQGSGQLGQSPWSVPGQARGQIQGTAPAVQNVEQSAWSPPGQSGISLAPKAASPMNTGMSPMDWVNANRAMVAKARDQHAQRINQSQWSPAAAFGGSNNFNSATMAPMGAAQDPSADLTGAVSQVDIVGDSTAFQAANDDAYGRVTPRIAGNGQGSYQGNTGFGEPVGEAIGQPAGEPVDGAAPSMQEMMASMIAVPMMMAANAGLLGQGFGRPIAGGFRSYSGGGIAVTPRTMGIGIAGYSLGRMANRLGNQMARQAMRGAGR